MAEREATARQVNQVCGTSVPFHLQLCRGLILPGFRTKKWKKSSPRQLNLRSIPAALPMALIDHVCFIASSLNSEFHLAFLLYLQLNYINRTCPPHRRPLINVPRVRQLGNTPAALAVYTIGNANDIWL